MTNFCDDHDTNSNDENSIDDTVEEFQKIQDSTQPHTTAKRMKSKNDILNYPKRSNERTAIINSIQSQNEYLLARENSVDDVDIFFKSIAMTVKKFPPKGIIEAKLQALTLVSNLQEKYPLGEPTISGFSKPTQPHSVYSNNSSLLSI